MNRGPAAVRMWLGALACAGMAGAHWLAYALAGAGSDPHDRLLLESTGHSYWPYLAALAMGALLVGFAGP